MTPQNQQDQSPIQPMGKEPVREQDKIMLVLAYFGCLTLIPLLTVKDSDYVKFHAKQGLALLLLSVANSLLQFVPFIRYLGCFTSLAIFIVSILGMVKALAGERWRIPVVSDIADKINL
jgi:uncharacterized membrane protein